MSEERISLKVRFSMDSFPLYYVTKRDICQDTEEAIANFIKSYQSTLFEYLLKFGGTLHLKGPASGLKNGKWGKILSMATKLTPTAKKADQLWKRLYKEGQFTVSWAKSPTFSELRKTLSPPSSPILESQRTPS